MKIEINKEHLEMAVTAASRIANKNLSLPVLGCAVVIADEAGVSVRATNLDMSISITVKAKVLEGGMVATPAHILAQTINTATDDKLVLTNSETTLSVTGARGSAQIKTIDPSDFPTLPFVKEGEGVSVVLQGRELVRALKSVSFSASATGMRPELSSVYVEIGDGMLTAAATDSFRLAEIKIPVKTKAATEPLLIPVRNVADIVRFIGSAETVEMRQGENQVTFLVDGSYLTSRTIDGAFPEYQAIVPKTFATHATVLTEDMQKALRKISVFVDTSNQVNLSVKTKEKAFVVEAHNTSIGETKEQVESVIEGEDVTINFNARYLLDALGAITSDSIVFNIAGAGKPMVMSDVPDRGFMYLVMPMNK
jgi:DNA polymerase-3 subunit beta